MYTLQLSKRFHVEYILRKDNSGLLCIVREIDIAVYTEKYVS